MTRKKLSRLRRELESLRPSPQKPRKLERLAKKLGRRLADRGKEPQWVSVPFPHLRPLSIPHHPGDLPRGTTLSILNQLADYDLVEWEALIEDASREDA